MESIIYPGLHILPEANKLTAYRFELVKTADGEEIVQAVPEYSDYGIWHGPIPWNTVGTVTFKEEGNEIEMILGYKIDVEWGREREMKA